MQQSNKIPFRKTQKVDPLISTKPLDNFRAIPYNYRRILQMAMTEEVMRLNVAHREYPPGLEAGAGTGGTKFPPEPGG